MSGEHLSKVDWVVGISGSIACLGTGGVAGAILGGRFVLAAMLFALTGYAAATYFLLRSCYIKEAEK